MSGDYKSWIDSLQIGDEVAIDVSRFGRQDFEIRKVERITPTRRFSVQGLSAEFDSYGNERGKMSAWDTRRKLQPVTQDVRNHIRKQYIVARMEKVNWIHLDLDKLEQFLKVVDGD